MVASEERKLDSQRIGLIGQMPKGEYEVLMDRIQNDLVAFGEFQAGEIVSNSICQNDFIDVEPRLTQSDSSGGDSRRVAKNASFLEDNSFEFDVSGGFKLSLFNKHKTQTVGVISLRNIQCKRRTSFLNLIAN